MTPAVKRSAAKKTQKSAKKLPALSNIWHRVMNNWQNLSLLVKNYNQLRGVVAVHEKKIALLEKKLASKTRKENKHHSKNT